MRCFVGVGSCLGDRYANLKRALIGIKAFSNAVSLRVSPIYETPALMPDGAPINWRCFYLNAVVEIEWTGSAFGLLKKLKNLEKEMGRIEAERWAPRIIDLDLLLFGEEFINEDGLKVPHPELSRRSFVLDPLKDLDPLLRIPGSQESVLIKSRQLKTRSPWVMAILNLTPDSFSDAGEVPTLQAVESKIELIERSGVQGIDIGAESTRPGAKPVQQEEELQRLEPVLSLLQERRNNVPLKIFLSVDTRRSETAAFALSRGADCINDVSGLSDSAMLDILAESSCDYILMHSLTVPADSSRTLSPDCDPVIALKQWLSAKLETLDSRGIDLRRVIFDPGIGFGKTPNQSLSILKRINEFFEFPVRVLVGHSRKSFLKSLGAYDRPYRDAATLSISLRLARMGVDILRVHDFESHVAGLRAEMEMQQ